MKKGIAFVLAAVMCLGLVGCGEKAEGAKSVYNALEKVGKLSLEAEYQNVETKHMSSDKVSVLEQIVFRMPDEERELEHLQNACYIEMYPSEEKAAECAESISDKYWYIYTSGNMLLLIDRAITEKAAEEYSKAFGKAAAGEIKSYHGAERPFKDLPEGSCPLPDGIQPIEIYDAFKKEIENIEFRDNGYIGAPRVCFYDRNQGYDQGVFANIRAELEDVEENNGPAPDGSYNIVRGNIKIYFEKTLPEERIAEYTKVLDELLK